METYYAVYNNNKPASSKGYPKLEGIKRWEEYIFETLSEAQKYANEWMGMWNPGRPLELNEQYNYSGYGDYMVIEETNVAPKKKADSISLKDFRQCTMDSDATSDLYVYIKSLQAYRPVMKVGMSGSNSPFTKPQIILEI